MRHRRRRALRRVSDFCQLALTSSAPRSPPSHIAVSMPRAKPSSGRANRVVPCSCCCQERRPSSSSRETAKWRGLRRVDSSVRCRSSRSPSERHRAHDRRFRGARNHGRRLQAVRARESGSRRAGRRRVSSRQAELDRPARRTPRPRLQKRRSGSSTASNGSSVSSRTECWLQDWRGVGS
jgi:hypothetical protein